MKFYFILEFLVFVCFDAIFLAISTNPPKSRLYSDPEMVIAGPK